MNYDPLDVAAQERAKEAEEQKRLVEEEQAGLDLDWVMSDARGRRFMHRLLSATGLHRNPYQGKREDTDFRCGEVNIGQRVYAEIMSFCPDRYLVMDKEARTPRGKNK